MILPESCRPVISEIRKYLENIDIVAMHENGFVHWWLVCFVVPLFLMVELELSSWNRKMSEAMVVLVSRRVCAVCLLKSREVFRPH